MTYKLINSEELWHFGIKGQKWGIRRWQNPDGSYNAAGKVRYAQFKDDVEERAKSNHDKINKFKNDRIKLQEESKRIQNEYDKTYKNIANTKLSDEQKNKVWSKLKREFGSPKNIDDEELYQLEVYDAVEDVLSKSIDKKLISDTNKLRENKQVYEYEAHDYAEKIAKEYSKVKIADVKNTKATKEARKVVVELLGLEMNERYPLDIVFAKLNSVKMPNNSDEFNEAVIKIADDFSIDEFAKHS